MIFQNIYILIMILIIYDVLNYIVHIILHYPYMYKHIHHIHHKYEVGSYGLTAFFAHTIENIINIFCILIPLFLLKEYTNIYMNIFVLIHYVFGSIYTHSELNKNNFHCIHHKFSNCNFSSFGYLDYLFGTNYNSKYNRTMK